MKLADLGLKTKPATKYFDHGYISFKTFEKELYYSFSHWTLDKKTLWSSVFAKVKNREQLNNLLAIKTVNQALEMLN